MLLVLLDVHSELVSLHSLIYSMFLSLGMVNSDELSPNELNTTRILINTTNEIF
jgi:hypothetical protein